MRGALYRRLLWKEKTRRTEQVLGQIARLEAQAPERFLRELLEHARQHVPYYRELLGGRGDFDPIPPLTKAAIRANFEQLKSHDLASRKWQLTSTGGSTGQPLTVVQDECFRDWMRASEVYYFRELLGVEPSETPMVVIWASSHFLWGHRLSRRMRLGLWLTRTQMLGASRITRQDFERYIEVINARKPLVIKSYANPIYQIARYARERKLRVHSPKFIYSTSEMMRPFMRETIEEVFGCPVYDFYGSREVGCIAGQCRRGKMHLFTFNNAVEVVDSQGRAVKTGEEGRLLLTTLHNYAMPLIRYDIADMAVPGAPCECGCSLPTLERVVGRITDYFLTREGSFVYGGYFMQLLRARQWVDEFQVVQKGVEEVEIRYVPRGELPEGDREEIEGKVRLVMGSDCRIAWSAMDEIPLTPHGKLLYTQCLVGNQYEGAE